MGEKEQGRKIPHSKKNPYIMTIGFDRTDPRHVEVADFLNSLPRKKAQYIVDAVTHYRQTGGIENDIADVSPGYDKIREIVMQVIREQDRAGTPEEADGNLLSGHNAAEEFAARDITDIFSSLKAFRQK